MVLGLILGVLGAGALMYYIQPTVKVWVAKAFGTEAALAADYQVLAAKVMAVKAAATKVTAPTNPPTTPPSPPAGAAS